MRNTGRRKDKKRKYTCKYTYKCFPYSILVILTRIPTIINKAEVFFCLVRPSNMVYFKLNSPDLEFCPFSDPRLVSPLYPKICVSHLKVNSDYPWGHKEAF